MRYLILLLPLLLGGCATAKLPVKVARAAVKAGEWHAEKLKLWSIEKIIKNIKLFLSEERLKSIEKISNFLFHNSCLAIGRISQE